MFRISTLISIFGSFLLILSIINILTATQITPILVRSETISGIASICLISIGILWKEIKTKVSDRVDLEGIAGCELCEKLSD